MIWHADPVLDTALATAFASRIMRPSSIQSVCSGGHARAMHAAKRGGDADVMLNIAAEKQTPFLQQPSRTCLGQI
jgi:hypothetical protein